jgi:hypothetical protein
MERRAARDELGRVHAGSAALVSDVIHVDREVAEKLRFRARRQWRLVAVSGDADEDGTSRFRAGAMPSSTSRIRLLQQGLVILDTPGLNAIGTEPELTCRCFPTRMPYSSSWPPTPGVTQSDLTIWNEHIGAPGGRRKGRLVVLNKIDSLWDELKSEDGNRRRDHQAGRTAAPGRSTCRKPDLPDSAQKALVAKINGDDDAAERSRLRNLNRALQRTDPGQTGDRPREHRRRVFRFYQRMRGLLESRLAGLREQLGELTELRGKNKGVVEYMMGKVRSRRKSSNPACSATTPCAAFSRR